MSNVSPWASFEISDLIQSICSDGAAAARSTEKRWIRGMKPWLASVALVSASNVEMPLAVFL